MIEALPAEPAPIAISPLADPSVRKAALSPFSAAIDGLFASNGKQLDVASQPRAYAKLAPGATVGFDRLATAPLNHAFGENGALAGELGRDVHYVMDVSKGSRSKFLSLEFETPLEELLHLEKLSVLICASSSQPISIGVSVFLKLKGQGRERLKGRSGLVSPGSTRFVSTVTLDTDPPFDPKRYANAKLSLMLPSGEDYTLTIYDIRTLGTLRLPRVRQSS